MSWARTIRTILVTVATSGLVWPGTGSLAGQPEPVAAAADSRVPDVQLDGAGQLRGMVVDGQGHGQPATRVMLSRVGDGPTRVAVTDADGRFTLSALQGGTFRLQTSDGISICRIWTMAAAPPGAARSLLVVNDRLVQRGQRPIRELFTSDPIIVATLVAAAIAIPIAVHKSRDDSPSGS